jgi:hypothetical protein
MLVDVTALTVSPAGLAGGGGGAAVVAVRVAAALSPAAL